MLNPRRIIITIALGIGVAGYLLYSELDPEAFKQINFTYTSAFWIFIAVMAAVTREVGYMYRLRVLSDKRISWRNSFDAIMLWEFSSAITPSVIGGSGIAIFILSKEKLSVGRSTSIVMITAFLDELFYVLMVPLLFLLVGADLLFPEHIGTWEVMGIEMGVMQAFWVGYGFIIALITVIMYGIFISPQRFKSLLVRIFTTRLLKRWLRAAYRTGDEIITTSAEMKDKPAMFWARAFGATAVSWTARFMVANFILMAFINLDFAENLVVLSRQLIMWVIMLISPTPGSAGVAEFAFKEFFDGIVPLGLVAGIAFLWRVFTFYPYLFLGAVILPQWIQRVYLGRRFIKFRVPGTAKKKES